MSRAPQYGQKRGARCPAKGCARHVAPPAPLCARCLDGLSPDLREAIARLSRGAAQTADISMRQDCQRALTLAVDAAKEVLAAERDLYPAPEKRKTG